MQPNWRRMSLLKRAQISGREMVRQSRSMVSDTLCISELMVRRSAESRLLLCRKILTTLFPCPQLELKSITLYRFCH